MLKAGEEDSVNGEVESAPKEPSGEPGEEQDDDDEGGEEMWMKDKHGYTISPKALYMRFYRKLRSTLASLGEQSKVVCGKWGPKGVSKTILLKGITTRMY